MTQLSLNTQRVKLVRWTAAAVLDQLRRRSTTIVREIYNIYTGRMMLIRLLSLVALLFVVEGSAKTSTPQMVRIDFRSLLNVPSHC